MKFIYLKWLLLISSFSMKAGSETVKIFEPIDEKKFDVELSEALGHYKIFTLDKRKALYSLGSGDRNFLIEVGDMEQEYFIYENHIKSSKYKLTGASLSPEEKAASSSIKTYKGVKNGELNESVSLTTGPIGLVLGIEDGSEIYVYEPLKFIVNGAPESLYVAYYLKDLKVSDSARCGWRAGLKSKNFTEHLDISSLKSASSCLVAEVCLAADQPFITDAGGVVNAENQWLTTFNFTQTHFEGAPLEIEYRILEIRMLSADEILPDSELDAAVILPSFANWGNAGNFSTNDYDIASLVTTRDISFGGSSGVVGVAYQGFVCTNGRYNVNEKFTWSLAYLSKIVSHEYGHNWGSGHRSSSTSFFMSPAVAPSANIWAPASQTQILNHKATRTCLEACAALNTNLLDFSKRDNALHWSLSAAEPGTSIEIYSGQTMQEMTPIYSYNFKKASDLYSNSLVTIRNQDYYKILIRDQNGRIIRQKVLKARNNLQENEFSIFPNPALSVTHSFQIRYLGKIESLEVFDRNGRKIAFSASNENRLIQFERKLSQGIYLIRIRSAKDTKIRKLLIQ